MLIHGAWHGAWAWDRLVPELEALGHRAVTIDLPCEDPDAGCSRCADIVAAGIDGVEAPVVIGHSLSGLIAALVAELRPVRRLVYLGAIVPKPGLSLADRFERGEQILGPENGARELDAAGLSYWPDPEEAIRVLYHDCEPGVAAEVVARLCHQSQAPSLEPCPLRSMPRLPTQYVVCREDRMVSPAYGRRAALQLGVKPLELPGGHSPMLSRPAELAGLLSRPSD